MSRGTRGAGTAARGAPRGIATHQVRKRRRMRRPSRDDAILDATLTESEVMDRGGYAYIVHPLMDGVPRCDPALLRAFLDWALRQDVLRNATLLAAPEAMGLPLVAALSIATGIPYVVIRKRRYDLPGEEVAYCETGYGENCLHVNDCWPDDRVVVVDDVISTGNTLDAILATLGTMGVPVEGSLVFLDKGKRRAAMAKRHKSPIKAMRTVKVEDGKVRIVRRG
ncbi:MAG: adenine phosphoribosyltransferase [Thermoplasmatota archaeon]|nr:adenine phosphoribosyltransferase [Halobacteriales archaeon]